MKEIRIRLDDKVHRDLVKAAKFNKRTIQAQAAVVIEQGVSVTETAP